MKRLGTPTSVHPPLPRTGRQREFIYAVLDAARSPEILPRLKELPDGWMCLYRGEPADTLADVAPYIIQLEPAGEPLRWVIDKGIGDSWGILATSQAPMEVVHRHFRKFLLVEDEEYRKLYFRFYDPRVLRIFLPTCTAEEAQEFFGPISRFVIEESEDKLHVFVLRSSGAYKEKLPLPKDSVAGYLNSLGFER
jgi:hypothetical protein